MMGRKPFPAQENHKEGREEFPHQTISLHVCEVKENGDKTRKEPGHRRSQDKQRPASKCRKEEAVFPGLPLTFACAMLSVKGALGDSPDGEAGLG